MTRSQTQRVRDALRELTLSAPADTLEWQPDEQQRMWSTLAAQALRREFITAKVGLRIPTRPLLYGSGVSGRRAALAAARPCRQRHRLGSDSREPCR